jgi:TfdA family taurine catabolism dioxygenase TauD
VTLREKLLDGVGLLHSVHAQIEDRGYAYLTPGKDGFDHFAFLSRLGEPIPQYDGKLIWDIVPEPGMDDVYHSKNTRALVPHTEGYELAGTPPRYLGLWCVTPAEGPGGETTLADGYEFLRGFTPAQRRLMTQVRYRWHSSEGLARHGIRISSEHPLLAHGNGRLILRFSANNVTVVDDGLLPGVLEAGRGFFERHHRAITVGQGALLVWDNWRMMHSRNPFTDRRRHLRRVLLAVRGA